jgi:hypothetical protein
MKKKMLIPVLFSMIGIAGFAQEMADVEQTLTTIPGGEDLVQSKVIPNQPETIVRGNMPVSKLMDTKTGIVPEMKWDEQFFIPKENEITLVKK